MDRLSEYTGPCERLDRHAPLWTRSGYCLTNWMVLVKFDSIVAGEFGPDHTRTGDWGREGIEKLVANTANSFGHTEGGHE